MRAERQIRLKIAELRRELRQRKSERIGTVIRKGRGSRDRDEELRAQRGYVEPGSIVRRDGSEKLVGLDWLLRKQVLDVRSMGGCERVSILGKPHAQGCDYKGTEPHHIVKRSIRRDDRLENLANLSHACHLAEDPRKTRFGERPASGSRSQE